MQVANLFADINTNCITEVTAAAASFYCPVKGLTVRQSFFVYPDDTIVCLNSCDGGYEASVLDRDAAATFNHLYN